MSYDLKRDLILKLFFMGLILMLVLLINVAVYEANAQGEEENKNLLTVPQGDRNLEEFGECREYEIQKGVCAE